MRTAVWIGVRTCSQTPDTTRPMANPATPVVKPPKKVAARNNPTDTSSIGRSQRELTSAWMAMHLKGRLCCPRQKLVMSGVAHGHSAIGPAPAKRARRSAGAECLETPGDCNSARQASYVGRQQKNQGA